MTCACAGLQSGHEGTQDFTIAKTVQCITPVLPAADIPDTSLLRYSAAKAATTMFQQQLITDDRIVVKNHTFRVPRAMLASASPIFETAYNCLLEAAQPPCNGLRA